jgi:Glucose-6-phosphate dehydrogenase, C-terminal domain
MPRQVVAKGSGRAGATDRREAVRTRPSFGAGAQPDLALRGRGVADFSASTTSWERSPYRTSSVSLLQRTVRAGLEPPAHRLRADRRPRAADHRRPAGFFETTGTFRNMVVTHLLHGLGFIAMEPPSRLDATSLVRRAARCSMRGRRWIRRGLSTANRRLPLRARGGS